MLETIFTIILLLVIIAGIYFLIRNQLVFNFRIKVLYEDINLYMSMPSYRAMLYSFKKLTKENWVKN